jgi:insulysin
MDVRGALMDYHNAFYSANLMSLAVLGSETLDELQTIVEEMFVDVENRDVEAPYWSENPYGPNELQTRIEMVPVKDIRQLSVMFPIPDTTPQYKSWVILKSINP